MNVLFAAMHVFMRSACTIKLICVTVYLTLKGPGFFVYLKSGGGADSEIWHIRRGGQYKRADKISILKFKAFLNYANLCKLYACFLIFNYN